jgi:hypothetical protein
MNKIFDIFLGRLDGWHTTRIAQNVDDKTVSEWIKNGYRIETEHQIGVRLHEVYLVKA